MIPIITSDILNVNTAPASSYRGIYSADRLNQKSSDCSGRCSRLVIMSEKQPVTPEPTMHAAPREGRETR